MSQGPSGRPKKVDPFRTRALGTHSTAFRATCTRYFNNFMAHYLQENKPFRFSPSNQAIQFLKAAIDFFSSNHNAYFFKVNYINYRFLRLFLGLREMVSLSLGPTVNLYLHIYVRTYITVRYLFLRGTW